MGRWYSDGIAPLKQAASTARLIAVVGPTASGKSGLAIALAQQLGGEIVSCDSVQLYRGFDIGSAKTPESERNGVPHHLIDVLDPTERATAGDYSRMARKAIHAISARGATPIIVGGTGFYLRAALEGLFTGPERDEALRARLEVIAEARIGGYLHRILARLDAASAKRIHPNDRPKIVRAIEVCLAARRPFSAQLADATEQPLTGYDVIRIGLAPEREALYARIDRRTSAMFSAGLLEEVQALMDAGVPEDAWPFGAVGYKEALDVVTGRSCVEDALKAAAQATRRYAKRQMTWFRRQEPEVTWLEGFGDDVEIQSAALRLV